MDIGGQGLNHENRLAFQPNPIIQPEWNPKNSDCYTKWRVRQRVKNNSPIIDIKMISRCQRCRRSIFRQKCAVESLQNPLAKPHYVGKRCALRFIIEKDGQPLRDVGIKQKFLNELINNSKIALDAEQINIVSQSQKNQTSSIKPQKRTCLSPAFKNNPIYFSFILKKTRFLRKLRKYYELSQTLKNIYNSVEKIRIKGARYTFKNYRDAQVCAAIAGYKNIRNLPSFLALPKMQKIKYDSLILQYKDINIFNKFYKKYVNNEEDTSEIQTYQERNNQQTLIAETRNDRVVPQNEERSCPSVSPLRVQSSPISHSRSPRKSIIVQDQLDSYTRFFWLQKSNNKNQQQKNNSNSLSGDKRNQNPPKQ